MNTERNNVKTNAGYKIIASAITMDLLKDYRVELESRTARAGKHLKNVLWNAKLPNGKNARYEESRKKDIDDKESEYNKFLNKNKLYKGLFENDEDTYDRYFKENLLEISLALTDERLLQYLLYTKLPTIYAEEAATIAIDNEKKTIKNWTAQELSILNKVIIEADVQVYDNGRRGEKVIPEKHTNPFPATLFFVSGPLLKSDTKKYTTQEYQELVIPNKKNKPEINEAEYNKFIEDLILPILLRIDERAKISGEKAFVQIPGLGCGAFAGNFESTIPSNLLRAIKNILENHKDKFKNIAAVRLDLYGQFDRLIKLEKVDKIGTIDFLAADSKHDGKPQLSTLSQFGEAYSNCHLYKIVAGDPIALPGNDYNSDFTTTDEGRTAASTNLQTVITGIEGEYDSSSGKYIPKDHSKTWKTTFYGKDGNPTGKFRLELGMDQSNFIKQLPDQSFITTTSTTTSTITTEEITNQTLHSTPVIQQQTEQGSSQQNTAKFKAVVSEETMDFLAQYKKDLCNKVKKPGTMLRILIANSINKSPENTFQEQPNIGNVTEDEKRFLENLNNTEFLNLLLQIKITPKPTGKKQKNKSAEIKNVDQSSSNTKTRKIPKKERVQKVISDDLFGKVTIEELSILQNVLIEVDDVTVYGNQNSLQDLTFNPFNCCLFFVPSYLYKDNGQIDNNTMHKRWEDLKTQNYYDVTNKKTTEEKTEEEFDIEKYFKLVEKSLLPVLMRINEKAASKNRKAFVQLPCLCSSMKIFSKEQHENFPDAIRKILEKNIGKLENIAAVKLNLCPVDLISIYNASKEKIGGTDFIKADYKKRLQKPSEFDKAYENCDLYEIVDVNPLSFSRSSDITNIDFPYTLILKFTNYQAVFGGINGKFDQTKKTYELEKSSTQLKETFKITDGNLIRQDISGKTNKNEQEITATITTTKILKKPVEPTVEEKTVVPTKQETTETHNNTGILEKSVEPTVVEPAVEEKTTVPTKQETTKIKQFIQKHQNAIYWSTAIGASIVTTILITAIIAALIFTGGLAAPAAIAAFGLGALATSLVTGAIYGAASGVFILLASFAYKTTTKLSEKISSARTSVERTKPFLQKNYCQITNNVSVPLSNNTQTEQSQRPQNFKQKP